MLSDIHRSGWGRDKISWRRPPRNFERRKNPGSHIIVIVAALGYVAYAEALQYVVVIDIHQMIP